MAHRRSFHCLILGLGVVACAAHPTSDPAPAGHTLRAATRSENTSDEPALPMPSGREVSFEVELAQVSKLRQLPVNDALQGLEVEGDELLAHVKRAVALQVPDHALKGTEAMLIGLGVVPRDFDYRATMLRLLSDKLKGLYDPHLKTMMVRSGLAPDMREMTLLHELVHALQDQHYELSEIVEWHLDDTDRSAALSALAEGDATSAMFDGMLREGQAIDAPAGYFQSQMRADQRSPTAGVPPVINRSLTASYLDGLTFIHALRRRGGWKEVNRVWETPPTTTEQILHLDKYDAREQPLEVAVPASPGEGWTAVLHDVWGEQNVRLIFEEWLTLTDAAVAAAGWGGDRIVVYENDDRQLVAWHIVGDTDADGEKMRAAFRTGISTEEEGDASCGRIRSARTYWCVGGRGADVLVVSSPLTDSASDDEHQKAVLGYISTH